MKDLSVVVLFVLFGVALFFFRRPVGEAAERFRFPPFFTGDQEARVRLVGMIGIVHALIAGGIGVLLLFSRFQ